MTIGRKGTIMKIDFKKLEKEILKISSNKLDIKDKLLSICTLLRENIDYYNWVGFYFVKNGRNLILGPFSGENTEHKKIKFGEGICGQAAELKKTFVIQDVSKESNYLSCSPSVTSEIVVPIFKNNNIIGEIDIDSHTVAPFTERDRKFLEKIAGILSDKGVYL
jgi:GAF domain-containing protein